MLTLTLLLVVASLVVYAIRHALKVNNFWKERGIKHHTPLPFIGNILPILLKKKTLSELLIDLVKTYPEEQLTGFYENLTPRLIIQDPEYIEKVLIKDFVYFIDHGLAVADEKKQPIEHYQLFFMTGAKWRAFRYKMSPLFTSGKLKSMFQAFDIVGEKLIEHIEKSPKSDVIMRDAMHLYSLDFVGLAVFGLNPSCLENPGSEYHRMGTNVFDLNYFKMVLNKLFPKLFYKLGFSFNNPEAVKYFCNIIKDVFNYRKEHNITRNDFIQMMMELKEKGKIDIHKWDPNDDYLKDEGYTPTEVIEITDVSLMSQAFTFMTTGVEAIAVVVIYALYELTQHQEIQEKVRDEIAQQIELHSGLTYDALKGMTYLEKVVSETLRIHSISQTVVRMCNKDYTFPNGYTIKQGETLHIPQRAVHLNPNFHYDPEEFKPERFEYPMKPCSYIPFGDGPRVCIAMRFALLQVKYGLAKLLFHYKFKLSPKTVLPLKLMPQTIMDQPAQTLYFDLEKYN